MPIITPADLGTHIYPEVVSNMIRNNADIAVSAIGAAIQEVKAYLSKYDLLQLFGDDETDATVDDAYLTTLVKDIACWHLLRLANTGISYTAFRTVYEDAVTTLKAIAAGDIAPQDWPLLDTSAEVSAVTWSSNDKRDNYF